MFKFTLKIIFMGLLFGLIGTSLLMLFGITINLFLNNKFLKPAAICSIVFGFSCCISWYIYILYLSRKYMKLLFKKFLEKR